MAQIFQIFLFLLFVIPLYSSEDFHHVLNQVSNHKIKRYFVVGERCSGTNFIASLFQNNFPLVSPTADYGHKHFLWWYEAPENKEVMQKLGYTSKHLNLEESEDCLFIFVIRDPYEWLRSFYSTPHHVHFDLLNNSFLHFISHTWKFYEVHLPHHAPYELIDNLNPSTNRPFKNVCELRSSKIRNYLLLGSKVENFLIVQYEKALKDPEGFINFIASHYRLSPSEEFVPVSSYKGLGEEPYKKKKYSSIKRDSLSYINENLDWELENQLGYSEKPVEKKSQISLFFRQLECKCRKFVRSL